MRRNSPGREFVTPSDSLNAFSERTAFTVSALGGRCNSDTSSFAGTSHGDLLRSGDARTTVCPARDKALTRLRTCTDAPFRPNTGMPRSVQRNRIFIAFRDPPVLPQHSSLAGE